MVIRVVAVVALAVVAACSGGDGTLLDDLSADTTTSTTAVAEPRPMELLWSTPGRFASRPKIVGDRVVAYVVAEDGLKLAAFELSSGVEVWRRESTASSVTPGVPISLAADDRNAFQMTPRPGGVAAIEAVDVATGEPAWITEGSVNGFVDVLEPCLDQPQQLCVGAADGNLWRIDAATGAVTKSPGFEGRELAVGLYDLRGDGEHVVRMVDGREVWRRPPSELFQGKDVTSDNGWIWQERDGLLVGWLGTRQEWPDDGELEFAPQFMAGVDAATGETRWVAEGSFLCGFRLWGMTLRVDGAEPLIRCRLTGSHHLDGGEITTTVITSAVVEGFDPATGAATWSMDLGAASALSDDTKLLVRLSPTSFTFVADDNTRHAVDIRTGEAIEVAPDAVGWCISSNDVHLGDEIRSGEHFTTPCAPDGSPKPVPEGPDELLGAVGDGRFAWVNEAGLHVALVQR